MKMKFSADKKYYNFSQENLIQRLQMFKILTDIIIHFNQYHHNN